MIILNFEKKKQNLKMRRWMKPANNNNNNNNNDDWQVDRAPYNHSGFTGNFFFFFLKLPITPASYYFVFFFIHSFIQYLPMSGMVDYNNGNHHHQHFPSLTNNKQQCQSDYHSESFHHYRMRILKFSFFLLLL